MAFLVTGTMEGADEGVYLLDRFSGRSFVMVVEGLMVVLALDGGWGTWGRVHDEGVQGQEENPAFCHVPWNAFLGILIETLHM